MRRRRGRPAAQFFAERRAATMPRNRAIFSAWRNGVAVAELAALHGVSRQRVHQIIDFVARCDGGKA